MILICSWREWILISILELFHLPLFSRIVRTIVRQWCSTNPFMICMTSCIKSNLSILNLFYKSSFNAFTLSTKPLLIDSWVKRATKIFLDNVLIRSAACICCTWTKLDADTVSMIEISSVISRSRAVIRCLGWWNRL